MNVLKNLIRKRALAAFAGAMAVALPAAASVVAMPAAAQAQADQLQRAASALRAITTTVSYTHLTLPTSDLV